MAIFELILQLAQALSTVLALSVAATPPTPVVTPASVAPTQTLAPPAVTYYFSGGVELVETDSGCLDVYCPYGHQRANYYAPQYRTVVVATGQRATTIQHEFCHAHQHDQVLAAGLPVTVDLSSWYDTVEGRAWAAAGVSSVFTLSAETPLESFATYCAWYLLQPDELAARDAHGYAQIAGLLEAR